MNVQKKNDMRSSDQTLSLRYFSFSVHLMLYYFLKFILFHCFVLFLLWFSHIVKSLLRLRNMNKINIVGVLLFESCQEW